MRIIFPLLLLLIISPLARGQEISPALPSSIKKIMSKAKKISLDESNISYSIMELNTDAEVSYFNSQVNILPASLSKILTSYYALSVLGENHQFITTLHSTGYVKGGILKGDLFFKGDGDPLLSNSDLINFALALKKKGITKITGHFYYDASKYPKVEKISEIGLGDQTYNPGVSALSLEFNRFTVWQKLRPAFHEKRFTPIPNIPYFQIQETNSQFPLGLKFLYHKDNMNREVWSLSRRNKYKFSEEVPIRKPAKYVTETFRMIARNMGIDLPESKSIQFYKESPQAKKNLIFNSYSRPLHLIVKSTMEYSNNLLAELLLLAADYKSFQSQSLQEAASNMIKWLRKKNKDIHFEKAQFQNGSGLDTKNKISARSLTHFLSKKTSKKIQSKFFLSFFSISGQSGWLTKRLHDPVMSFKIFAKTGSLNYINNLSGVLFAKSNKAYAFTISIYDLPKRKALDSGNLAKAHSLRVKSKSWNRAAKKVQDNIIKHFYQTL